VSDPFYIPSMVESHVTASTRQPDESGMTPGQAINLSCHDLLPAKEPRQRYLIFSQPRTGSNYLCRRLCNVRGRFGLPSEYLNPRHVPLLLPRLIPSKADSAIITADLSAYLSALGRVRTTDDRMFGIKVHVAQLVHHIGRDIDRVMSFVEGFDRIILMTRGDKLDVVAA
jgi:LPS sulfotransferase NodH